MADPTPAAPVSPPMPLPGTSTPIATVTEPTIETNEETPFSVFVRNCYLVDPEINPIGAPESREKGIRLVTRGRIRNNTSRIIYRAGVYSQLVVNFEKNAKFEKHSGGLGFDPPVTSTNPWRPGTWRDFDIVGRAFDPIYREFAPQTITGILTLEAKDPIGFKFSAEVARMRPLWSVLFGAVTDMKVKSTATTSVRMGPHEYKTDIKEGDEVRLAAQQGGGFLVEKNDRLAGWMAEKELAIPQYESLYPENPQRTFPMVATEEGRYQFTVTDYRFHPEVPGLPASTGGYMSFHMKIKNIAKTGALAAKPVFFWVDQGSGRFSSAVTPQKTMPDALAVTEQLTAGAEIGGWLYFPRLADGWPFALVFQTSTTQIPVHIFLLPAIGREGPKLTPGATQ